MRVCFAHNGQTESPVSGCVACDDVVEAAGLFEVWWEERNPERMLEVFGDDFVKSLHDGWQSLFIQGFIAGRSKLTKPIPILK
jgi:hypothetical protein